MSSFVYIMTNQNHGTLYVGVTSDLVQRVYQHKQGVTEGFTKKYTVDRLVYFEVFSDIKEAIVREKQIKHWKREWKIRLIEESNTNWRDLYSEIVS